jgi:hypothetical protein
VPEQKVPSSPTCNLFHCVWHLAVFSFQVLQGLVSSVSRVHVQYVEPRRFSGGVTVQARLKKNRLRAR